MNVAERIVSKFGSQSALAEKLGKKQSTVQYWVKTGHIPSKWHEPIIVAAGSEGLIIRRSDFQPQWETEGGEDHLGSALPVARWPGSIEIGDHALSCYVLDDGRRVISRTGAVGFLTGNKSHGNLDNYVSILPIQPFLPKDFDDGFVDFVLPNVVNKSVKGLRATMFIDLCSAYSRARDMGRLETEAQVAIAIRAAMVLCAFAKNGIEATIDEATGYQYERTQDALRVKLNLFLEDAVRAWEKTFPDELWIQFGRLTNWKGGSIHSRPKYWGQLVMELVYGYLDPDVAEWLKKHAPKPRHGMNYHQWLSGQYGLKKLTEHIWMLIGVASVCRDMRELRQRMAEKFGREPVQLTLYLPPAASHSSRPGRTIAPSVGQQLGGDPAGQKPTS